MRIDVLTVFPELVEAPLAGSIVGRAQQTGALDLAVHNIRTWTEDVHRTTDDTPYGGGAGMVMKAEPIVRGAEWIRETLGSIGETVILSATGERFNQSIAMEFSRLDHLLLICGRYEGIDDRVRLALGARELSIGDFVLTGGELAAAVVVDAVTRLLPGVIKAASTHDESHSPGSGGMLEYPQYTRPADFRGLHVPEILLSGNHSEIEKWRRRQSLLRTTLARPDLLMGSDLSDADRRWLDEQLDVIGTNETP